MGDGPGESGRVLAGRYRLGDVLGCGGMATVHRAVDTQLDRPVAVKLLRLTSADDSDQDRRRRAGREARTLATLDHPALVALYDAHFAEDSQESSFLVMEYVDGRTLADHLRDGPLPVDAAMRIGRQVAAGLHVVHERGIVHRDIKPSNILVPGDPRSGDSTVKITDFGIAVADGATRVTTPGALIGTAAYLSPEQVRGLSVTPAADIYALGLLLIELITGQMAYPGTWLESALARLNSPAHIPDHVDPELRALLGSMTAIDPSQRPTARIVKDRLSGRPVTSAAGQIAGPGRRAAVPDSAVSDRLVVARPAEPATASQQRVARRQPGRRRLLLRTAAAVPVAVLVILVGMSISDSGASFDAASASSETSRGDAGTAPVHAGRKPSKAPVRQVADSSAVLTSATRSSTPGSVAKSRAVPNSGKQLATASPTARRSTAPGRDQKMPTPGRTSAGTSIPSADSAGRRSAKSGPAAPGKALGHKTDANDSGHKTDAKDSGHKNTAKDSGHKNDGKDSGHEHDAKDSGHKKGAKAHGHPTPPPAKSRGPRPEPSDPGKPKPPAKVVHGPGRKAA